MKLRRIRAGKRGRIEIIAMIDVIFFLLATFMLASLSMQNLHSLAVNLPKGQAAVMTAKQSVTLTVTADNRILLNEVPVTLDSITDSLKPMLKQSEWEIIVSADETATQGIVVQAMLAARAAGANNFQIAVKHVR